MLGTVVLLLVLAQPACPSPASTASRRAEALKRLLEVFGIEDPPPPPAHSKQPPQYMVDLFNTVANADGVTKNPDVLEGNTVRSFLDKSKGGAPGWWGEGGCGRGLSAVPPPSRLAPLPNLLLPAAHGEKMRFLFVLSSVAKNEKILTAELHLFRLWPKATDGPKRHHFCQVRRGTGTGWGEGHGGTPSLCSGIPQVLSLHFPPFSPVPVPRGFPLQTHGCSSPFASFPRSASTKFWTRLNQTPPRGRSCWHPGSSHCRALAGRFLPSHRL